jgi:hypothetical protein
VVRASALLAAVGLLAAYFAASESLPNYSLWPEVAWLSLVLMPAVFALVGLALPARRALGDARLAVGVVALGAATAGLELGGLDVAANFTKLAAVTLAGWWFLHFFEAVSWVVLVALLIVPVDIVSVARGPTKVIVEEKPEVFDVLSIAFPIPGEHNSAELGLPDVLFFALFLAAAERFGLRVGWTWLAMALSFGATLAGAVWLEVAGLPALPLLSVAFVAVNADRLWSSYRAHRGGG